MITITIALFGIVGLSWKFRILSLLTNNKEILFEEESSRDRKLLINTLMEQVKLEIMVTKKFEYRDISKLGTILALLGNQDSNARIKSHDFSIE